MTMSLAACGGTADSGDAAAGSGEICYLNFKPEIKAEVYDEIAAAYEAETGVKLNVVTAASGTYEQTLKSEIAKEDTYAFPDKSG